jgi:hypothetical protein
VYPSHLFHGSSNPALDSGLGFFLVHFVFFLPTVGSRGGGSLRRDLNRVGPAAPRPPPWPLGVVGESQWVPGSVKNHHRMACYGVLGILMDSNGLFVGV